MTNYSAHSATATNCAKGDNDVRDECLSLEAPSAFVCNEPSNAAALTVVKAAVWCPGPDSAKYV